MPSSKKILVILERERGTLSTSYTATMILFYYTWFNKLYSAFASWFSQSDFKLLMVVINFIDLSRYKENLGKIPERRDSSHDN